MRTQSFRAMGSACRIVVDGGSTHLVDEACELIRRLESKWSRFLLDSEVTQANQNAGNITIVSNETFDLFSHAVDAQTLSHGLFNPLMLDQLVDLGYDAPWQDRHVVPVPSAGTCAQPALSDAIVLLDEISAVIVPQGAAFDPGGIGKGLAADLVTEFLVDHGATSTSVELGGDLRVSGESWYATEWRIGIANPFDPATDIATFSPQHGAVATSSTLRRRWAAGHEQRHHLLDPTTGRSADTDLVAVSACSTAAWWAEVAAKSALIAGSSRAVDLLCEFGTPGVAVAADGTVFSTHAAAATTVLSPPREMAMS